MVKKLISGFFRHLLTTLGGGGVAAGIISDDELTTVVSAIMALIGVALSAYNKYSDIKKNRTTVIKS